MPIFTEHDNMTISKDAFDLAKHMAVEQYKAELVEWLNQHYNIEYLEDIHDAGYLIETGVAELKILREIILHIEADNEKVE